METECTEDTILYVGFDEILSDGDVDYKRLGSMNGLRYDLKPGLFKLETIEPYTSKYLKLIVIKGQLKVKNIQIREYSGIKIDQAGFKSSSDKLNRIFDAGVETFRQNSLDIFMDCPSRERAGWDATNVLSCRPQ